jgi:glucose uptake protein
METLAIALITVLAWGVWLLPAHGLAIPPAVVTLYATLANLVVAFAVALAQPAFGAMPLRELLLTAAGGAVWGLGGVCAFAATARIGPARAMGLWSPVNILVSLLWGAVLFAEFAHASARSLALTALATAALMVGLILIVRARGCDDASSARGGFSGALWAAAAGIFWGSYFLPIRASGSSLWLAAAPMAAGMAFAALAVALAQRATVRVPARTALRLAASGALWAAGNYGSLLLMERIGIGRGFAIAQLCLVVNALAGIYWLRTPSPQTPAARRVFAGCLAAALGGTALGLSR